MHLRNAVIAAALLTVVGVSCGDSTESTSTELDAVPTAIEATASGDVTVNANVAVSGTRVSVEQSGGGADAETSAEIDDDGVLRLTDDCDPTDDTCSVDFTVEMRGDVEVEAVSTGGRIALTEVTGVIVVDSGGGNVNLVSTDGATQVTTGGGDVLATSIAAIESSFETGGGDADVTFDDPVDDLVVATEGGKLTVQLPGGPYAVDADTGGGSLDILVDESNDSPRSVTLRSGGGDVTMYRR